MNSVEIKGLLFVKTHESDLIRYDVRDADFNRVAYIEWDGRKLVCSTPDPNPIVLYETNVAEEA